MWGRPCTPNAGGTRDVAVGFTGEWYKKFIETPFLDRCELLSAKATLTESR